MPENIFEAIEDDNFSAEEFAKYLGLGAEATGFKKNKRSPLSFAIEHFLLSESDVLLEKIKILVERSYKDLSLNILPFEAYGRGYNLLEMLVAQQKDEAALIFFQALRPSDREKVFKRGAWGVSAVEIAGASGMDNFLSAIFSPNEMEDFKKIARSCHILASIYEDGEDPKWGCKDSIMAALCESQLLDIPLHHPFKLAADILHDGYFDDGELVKFTHEDKVFAVTEVYYRNHVAFFIVDFDPSGAPRSLSYCDAWKGIFGRNSQGYTFGETVFEIDESKVRTLEELETLLHEKFRDTQYSGRQETSKALRSIVKCDQLGNPIIIKKCQPTQVQSHNNCFTKSSLLAMRSLARRIDPTLDDDFQWKPEMEEAAKFPEFGAKDLGGKGRELYKSFKNHLIDEHIKVLQDNIEVVSHPYALFIIEQQLEKALQKTVEKHRKLHPDAPAGLAAALPEELEADKKMAEIYSQRREILGNCLKSIAQKKHAARRPQPGDGIKALTAVKTEKVTPPSVAF